ncbi:hypothetical protein [Aromatoleum toluclasticum]|uniref:hypothetical protein n=1 Tax=Aromatoleum toluclasticum TaxID=92003 RepID=UPI001D1953E1|nr:hypothetical protein [Aromatoleum toluclasticum]
MGAVGILSAYWGDTEIERNGLCAVGHVTKKELFLVANGDSDYIVEYWLVLPRGERVEVSRGVSKRLWKCVEKGGTFAVLYSAANPNRNFPVAGGVTSVGLTTFFLSLLPRLQSSATCSFAALFTCGAPMHKIAQRTLVVLMPILLNPALAAEDVPKDVAEFLKRGDLCEHFRQEPWPEGRSEEETERRAFIVKQIEEFCTGLPEAAFNLQERYRGNPSVLKELNEAKKWAE